MTAFRVLYMMRDFLTRIGVAQSNYSQTLAGTGIDIVTDQITVGPDGGVSILEADTSNAYVRGAVHLIGGLAGGVALVNAVGSDEVVNGTFTTDTAWTKGTGWTISGGQALKASGANTTTLQPSTALVPVSGTLYRLQYDVASYSSGDITASFGGATGATKSANVVGYYEYLLTSNATSNLVFTPSTSTALRLDNISLVKIGAVSSDQVICWVEDHDGTAAKASLYFRTEDGTIHKFGPAASLSEAALTLLTHTAPGTPDYAIQNLTQTNPFGFVTADEGNSVLKVILNLQNRMAVLEAALTVAGIVV